MTDNERRDKELQEIGHLLAMGETVVIPRHSFTCWITGGQCTCGAAARQQVIAERLAQLKHEKDPEEGGKGTS